MLNDLIARFLQLLELFVVLCAAAHYRHVFLKVRSAFAHAQDKSGSVRPDTMPTGLRNAPFSVLQVIVCFLVPATYLFAVVGAGLKQPSWMNALALPDVGPDARLGGIWKNSLRVLACIFGLTTTKVVDIVFDHLSDQYHPIGRREKPRVVQTGPYAWVRHPLYALALLQAVVQAVAFWSYAPLIAFVAIAVVFAIKIQIEEEIILRDAATREEYRAYMRKVPARLVPYVWQTEDRFAV